VNKFFTLVTISLYSVFSAFAQEVPPAGDLIKDLEVHGDFQSDAQYYKADSLIGAPVVPEKIRSNTFANFIFSSGNFTAGVRYEAYSPQLQGFDSRYQGSGIPYRYLSYDNGRLKFTVGNFYEQFGSGMILRTFEDRNLGYDNSIDGMRFRYELIKGLSVKGLIGRQRSFFTLGQGILRGGDAEAVFNDIFPNASLPAQIIVGASILSKYQKDEDPNLVLPENVSAVSGRINITSSKWNLYAEYAQKSNDPDLTNGSYYNKGQAMLVTAAYSQKSLGISLSAKRVDNMNFKSDRTATGNNLNINYLAALTKQHTYALAGTIYPYAIQPLGEMSAQAEITLNLKKGSVLGGVYGTSIAINLSAINAIQKNFINPTEDPGRLHYTSPFFGIGNTVYFRDYNIEITRKLSPTVKVSGTYLHQVYNKDVIQGVSGYGIITSDIAIGEATWRVKPNHTLRFEAQTLQTKQDYGSWAMGLIEYNFSSKFFAAVIDQYNYGNHEEKLQIHYITTSIGYNWATTSLRLTYGRQRQGIVCVGGVCRNVPASNGVMLTLTSSF